MGRCKKCGFDTDENFCPNCGTSMMPETPQNTQNQACPAAPNVAPALARTSSSRIARRLRRKTAKAS